MTARVHRLCRAVEELSTAELHDLEAGIAALIEAREQPPEPPENPNRVVVEERPTADGTWRLELVKCGKDRCKLCAGGPAHGPYWYLYGKQGRRTRSKYVGKPALGRGPGA